MNGSTDERDDLDADAGEFVLGTLSPQEQMRFEMLLRTNRRAQAAVAYWERRLAPLAGLALPVEPDPQLFGRIEQTIKLQARPARGRVMVPVHRRIWNSVSIWRGSAIGAGLLAAAFAGLLLIRPFPEQAGPSYVAVLGNSEGAPVWLVTADPGSSTISIDAVGQAPDDKRVPQLWLIPNNATKPISLGLLGTRSRTVTKIDPAQLADIGPGATLAVSLEPPGGSPTGAPTGPVVQQGKIVPYAP